MERKGKILLLSIFILLTAGHVAFTTTQNQLKTKFLLIQLILKLKIYNSIEKTTKAKSLIAFEI